MKRWTTLAVSAALLALALFAGACGHSFEASDRAAITQQLDAQRAAWNRGDVVAFMDAYDRADDIVFTSGGRIRRGYDETLAKYRKSYSDKDAMGRLGFEILEIRPLGPDAALVLGEWRLTETPKEGAGLFSLVFERRPEGWRIVHDHSSLRAGH